MRGTLTLCAMLAAMPLAVADERAGADALVNPLEASAAAVRDGRSTYLRLCQYCHGADGKAQANPDFEAPSLRDPSHWRYGTSDRALFLSIRDGAGHEMPAFGSKLEDARIWELVLFIRSIGPPGAGSPKGAGGP